MKLLLKCTSLEAAAHRYSLQAYANRSCKIRKKHLLYVLVSVLCTSCGSSGVPTEPDQDAALNANTGPATAGEAIIINREQLPFFVELQATDQSPIANVSNQIPPIGAAVGVDETEVNAIAEINTTPEVNAIAEVNTTPEVTTTPEVNAVAEVNALEAPTIEPEAETEFAALEAELIDFSSTCSTCEGLRLSWPENPSVEAVEGYRVLFVTENNPLTYSIVSDVPVAGLDGNAPNVVFDLIADLNLTASEGGCFTIKAYRGSEESEPSEAVCFYRS